MKYKTQLLLALGLGAMGAAPLALAADLTSVAATVTSQLKAVGQVLSLAAYVAGIGLAIASLMKFKAHKDNPTQEPLGKAVTMLIVAGSLLFLPTVMEVASSSLFGSASGSSASSFSIS